MDRKKKCTNVSCNGNFILTAQADLTDTRKGGVAGMCGRGQYVCVLIMIPKIIVAATQIVHGDQRIIGHVLQCLSLLANIY